MIVQDIRQFYVRSWMQTIHKSNLLCLLMSIPLEFCNHHERICLLTCNVLAAILQAIYKFARNCTMTCMQWTKFN